MLLNQCTICPPSYKMLRGHWQGVHQPPSSAGAKLVIRCPHMPGSRRRGSRHQLHLVRATLDLATAEPGIGAISEYTLTVPAEDSIIALYAIKGFCLAQNLEVLESSLEYNEYMLSLACRHCVRCEKPDLTQLARSIQMLPYRTLWHPLRAVMHHCSKAILIALITASTAACR